jgi:ceroid-lipofuscinosis MFS transporter 7
MASRQLGLMLGPAFNLFLRKANFVLFEKFVVNRWSSPGLFMALLWLVCALLLLIFYRDDETHRYQHKPNATSNQASDSKLSYKDYKKEFMRIEIFVLLLTTFFTYFNQTSLETMVIPFTEVCFSFLNISQIEF